jgi:hypothetical protein
MSMPSCSGERVVWHMESNMSIQGMLSRLHSESLNHFQLFTLELSVTSWSRCYVLQWEDSNNGRIGALTSTTATARTARPREAARDDNEEDKPLYCSLQSHNYTVCRPKYNLMPMRRRKQERV